MNKETVWLCTKPCPHALYSYRHSSLRYSILYLIRYNCSVRLYYIRNCFMWCRCDVWLTYFHMCIYIARLICLWYAIHRTTFSWSISTNKHPSQYSKRSNTGSIFAQKILVAPRPSIDVAPSRKCHVCRSDLIHHPPIDIPSYLTLGVLHNVYVHLRWAFGQASLPSRGKCRHSMTFPSRRLRQSRSSKSQAPIHKPTTTLTLWMQSCLETQNSLCTAVNEVGDVAHAAG